MIWSFNKKVKSVEMVFAKYEPRDQWQHSVCSVVAQNIILLLVCNLMEHFISAQILFSASSDTIRL